MTFIRTVGGDYINARRKFFRDAACPLSDFQLPYQGGSQG